MSENTELPGGTIVLPDAQPKGAGELDVELALDLARLGASPMAIRALGGEEAVRKAEASRRTWRTSLRLRNPTARRALGALGVL